MGNGKNAVGIAKQRRKNDLDINQRWISCCRILSIEQFNTLWIVLKYCIKGAFQHIALISPEKIYQMNDKDQYYK